MNIFEYNNNSLFADSINQWNTSMYKYVDLVCANVGVERNKNGSLSCVSLKVVLFGYGLDFEFHTE